MQAADVLVVLDDDEEGDGELDGDEERGARAVDQEQGKDGKAGRAEDGGQRDVAGDEKDEGEDGDGGQSCAGGGDQKDSKAGGDAFAAAETEPDGEDVAQDGEESGEGLCVADGEWRAEMGGEESAEPDRAGAFEHVEQEGDCAQSLCRRSGGRWWRRCCRCLRSGCPAGGRGGRAGSRWGWSRAGRRRPR